MERMLVNKSEMLTQLAKKFAEINIINEWSCKKNTGVGCPTELFQPLLVT